MAHHAKGCPILRKSMQQVPMLQQDLMAKHYEGKNDEGNNEKGIRLHLDLLDKARVTTEQRMTRYQDLMAKYYNAKVKP